MSKTMSTTNESTLAIEFALEIDDHYDRLYFLQSFLQGDLDPEEWDDWFKYRDKRMLDEGTRKGEKKPFFDALKDIFGYGKFS